MKGKIKMKQLSDSFAGQSVSHGTLKTDDLLETFIDFAIENKIITERPTIPEDEHEQTELLNEMFDTINWAAPFGCTFSAHPGDGSDFGFWANENVWVREGKFNLTEVHELLQPMNKKGHTQVFPLDNICVFVVLHGTGVVQIFEDSVVLKTGGHFTPTTKQRMNMASELADLGYQVYQKDYVWYVQIPGQKATFKNNRVQIDITDEGLEVK